MKNELAWRRVGLLLRESAYLLLLMCYVIVASNGTAFGNARLEDYEGRLIVSLDLTFENSPADSAAQTEFLSLLKVAAGMEFSAVRFLESL